MEHSLEWKLEENNRTIYGMCSIIPKPKRIYFNDSRLKGKERMSTMLSSDASRMEMFPFGHCPEGNEQSHDEVYGCVKGGSRNSGGKRLAIFIVEEAWLSEKKEV
ncbi:hypothetical protein Tco_1025557 [Tanacetum coccineum]